MINLTPKPRGGLRLYQSRQHSTLAWLRGIALRGEQMAIQLGKKMDQNASLLAPTLLEMPGMLYTSKEVLNN